MIATIVPKRRKGEGIKWVCAKCNISKEEGGEFNKQNPWMCKKCVRIMQRRNYEKRKDEINLSSKTRRYGIKPEQYKEILENQGGVCAICRRPEEGKSKLGNEKTLAVDHCHVTGKIRGLLCSKCNPGLGQFEDNINLLQAAIEYLKSHQGDV